jgi:hypothetical protein
MRFLSVLMLLMAVFTVFSSAAYFVPKFRPDRKVLSAAEIKEVVSCKEYIHTYHSCFIPERVTEVPQIFLRDTHVLPKLVSYDKA